MDQLKKLTRLFISDSRSRRDRDGRGEYSGGAPVSRPRLSQTQRSARGSIDMSNTASASCRQSVFNPLRFGSQNKPSPRRKRSTAEEIILKQSERRKSRVPRRDELLQHLQVEQEKLAQKHSRMNDENDRLRKDLEALRAQDDAEKWEDELYATRLKELENAHALIRTNSSGSGEDVLLRVRSLNEEIAHIASLALSRPIAESTPRASIDTISKHLGDEFATFLRKHGSLAVDEMKLVQGVLQVYLAHSCARLIDSWHVGEPELDNHLNQLYDRIRNKEEHMVAGKWRQIAFGQLPHGFESDILQQYTTETVQNIMELASCVGWEGDVPMIQQRMGNLMVEAETIRMDVKAGILSADFQPWVTRYGDRYDLEMMKDVGDDFGVGRAERDAERYHVLGSTELGLRVRKPASSTNSAYKSRTRVILIESFVERRRGSTRG
ncbi:hypothetical protein P691DRAFT_807550 [Macrolepiota fuliginosa MF-IS2]|uniref:Uncharacterized protein n=1 Tax=Macrolepiota fuliginosa MF-IS2 TaxID=1400762 RepID=A0A9P6BYJ2_9AGAR|nr:hypothetical protein P691DRAFT_807550 [Macrolepiota fuliginosa MF-IS2]